MDIKLKGWWKWKKVIKKVEFDMSLLSLSDLIKLYEEINEFISYLEEKKIVLEEESKEDEDE